MIQRIQSLWLLLATGLELLTIKFPFYIGNRLEGNSKVFTEIHAAYTLPLLILTVAVATSAFTAIFLFKDRKRQMLVVLGVLVGSLASLGYYFMLAKGLVEGEGKIALTSVIGLSAPVALLLAYRGIASDEKLVRSADRLR